MRATLPFMKIGPYSKDSDMRQNISVFIRYKTPRVTNFQDENSLKCSI